MDNVVITNADGTPVKVYDVMRNNYGQIESVLVDNPQDPKYRAWQKASDYVIRDANDMPVEPTPPAPRLPKQKQIPGRDAKLKPNTTITKPAVAPVQTDLGSEPVIEK